MATTDFAQEPTVPTYSAEEMAEKPGKSILNPNKVVVAIPAYNEERFIGSVVIQALKFGSMVLVIDDGSKDGTAYIARKAGAKVLRHPVNQGKSEALNTALEWARQNEVDALVFIDGDGQHRPEEIEQVLQPVQEGQADLVIGSRFLSIKSKIPTYRQFGQHALTSLTNVASSVSITDSQSGFRALSRRAIEVLHFNGRGFSVESEMQFLIKQHALRVQEVAISVIYQEKAKRNPFSHGLQIISAMAKLVGQHRPLLFFGVPGLVSIVLGVLLANIIVDIYNRAHELAMGYALIAVLLLVLGVLSIFVGLILHSVKAFFLDLKKVIQLRHTSWVEQHFSSDYTEPFTYDDPTLATSGAADSGSDSNISLNRLYQARQRMQRD